MVDIEKEDSIDEALLPTNEKHINTAALIKQGNDLTNQIIDEENPDKLKELTQLFTINQKKKDIARINKLSTLQELIDDEVASRLMSCPDSFDHDQLEKYMVSVQKSIKNINDNSTDVPQVLINNQTNVNINQSGLNRESREKVYNVVQELLNSLHTDNQDDIIDVNIKEQ